MKTTSDQHGQFTSRRRGVPLAGIAICLAAQLAACGSGSSSAPAPASSLATSPSAGSLAGTRVELEGRVEVLVEDHPDHARTRRFLETADRRVELEAPGATPELTTGARVRVKGTQTGEILALDPSGASLAPSTSSSLATVATPDTFGEQRTLVILVNFRDRPSDQPWTADQVRTLVFGKVSDFYRETSYQQTWFAGDVAGWYTLPLDSTSCDQLGIASYAKQAATSAGVDPSAYRRLVYLFPSNSTCAWSGTGSVGGNPSQAWINGYLQLDVIAHELGHNLGLHHSHSSNCTDGTSIGPGCSSLEYGDGLDVMGWSPAAQFNAFQKEFLGWLGTGAMPPITAVATSGTYAIDAYELPGSGTKALKILKSTDAATGKRIWYYVEYRQPLGFDQVLTSSTSQMNAANVVNGVTIHTGSADESGNTSFLLDLTPATYDLYTRDPALTVGSTFSDPAAGVTITTGWADGSTAGVRVTVSQPTCARASPAVAISPSSQSGAAGSRLVYTVSVSNRDEASCGTSTFSLQASLPTGFAGTLASPTLSVGAGASASTTLEVTSPASTAASSYGLQVGAASAASGLAGTASATYAVVSAPAVVVTSDRPSYTKNQTATLRATVTSGGAPAPGRAVTFVITKPNGAATTLAATTDASGVAAASFRIYRKDPTGAYRVSASSTSDGATGTGGTSFTVQ